MAETSRPATKQVSKGTAVAIVAAAILVASVIGVQRFRTLRAERVNVDATAQPPPLRVPLWLPPDAVRHHGRFAFLWDGPEPLAGFRQAEKLDAVIAGARSDEEIARKLMHWTRAQFEPGKPSPYPPPDATTTLSEIRNGRTGGFCAQYSFVLVQALQSFGRPARLVTIDGHEVVETWLPDQARWTMLDPLFDLQVLDRSSRSLSAIEIREAQDAGNPLAISEGNRLDGTPAAYLARYALIAIWTRNAFTSAPVNFTDFDRYRVWLVGTKDPGSSGASPESLRTTHAEDLYGPPSDFPR
ncbi:MAG TPA: transglutaminase-like domain-containing protein [Candidatus Polarisedimenticolaceae bacterium]|nr:transglutaminase-like domain-containing protein [Candidatus Polarisedimenticolaceae bacterium]